MQNIKKRPINLNLFAFAFPITAITSIAHRVTGVLLFVAVPLYMWLLDVSLADEAGFAKASTCMSSSGMKLFTWAVLCALAYHFLAGLRHLIMDLGFGESKCVAKLTSKVLIVVSVIVFALLGAWLW